MVIFHTKFGTIETRYFSEFVELRFFQENLKGESGLFLTPVLTL